MKKRYFIRLADFKFYDDSPYTQIPDTKTYSFKTARKRDTWHSKFTEHIKGLLSHSIYQWRAKYD